MHMSLQVICINAAISAAASAFAWPSALHLLGEMSTFALAPVANSDLDEPGSGAKHTRSPSSAVLPFFGGGLPY